MGSQTASDHLQMASGCKKIQGFKCFRLAYIWILSHLFLLKWLQEQPPSMYTAVDQALPLPWELEALQWIKGLELQGTFIQSSLISCYRVISCLQLRTHWRSLLKTITSSSRQSWVLCSPPLLHPQGPYVIPEIKPWLHLEPMSSLPIIFQAMRILSFVHPVPAGLTMFN